MFQEGEKALEEEVEGEEGTIEAKGEVVLLSVDELVTFITKGGKKTSLVLPRAHISLCVRQSNSKLTCDIGQQDGEEDHRSEKGGDHDVQRIPAAGGHLQVEKNQVGELCLNSLSLQVIQ